MHAKRAMSCSSLLKVLLALLSVSMLISCNGNMWRRRSPDFQRVPSYPNTRDEQVSAWQNCTRKGCFGEERRVVFQTDDTPAMVLAHYDSVLSQEGWTKSDSTANLPGYDYLIGCPFYSITVEAARSHDMTTHVEAILSHEGCR
jgi:hypothetical protein